MKAVHFGAGNIGRGFIGALLQDAGYHVTFADVNASLVAALNETGKYSLYELADSAAVEAREYSNFAAINSASARDALLEAIAEADVITTSVGPNILVHIAPNIAAGLTRRTTNKPAIVMACENAINATAALRRHIEVVLDGQPVNAQYANTAVDRIVPQQKPTLGLDVEVEPFCEWVIETSSLTNPGELSHLAKAGAQLVENLAPFIERKLFTVNAGHAATAYFGQRAGAKTIFDALQKPDVLKSVMGVLEETSKALVFKHQLDETTQAKYAKKTISRFQNPAIDDDLLRVGRGPIRKLSKNERLIAPAAILAEHGFEPTNLLLAVGAALKFESNEDTEVAVLHEKLTTLSAGEFATEVCGIATSHPLHTALTAVIEGNRS